MKIIKTYKLGDKYFKKEFTLSELENGEGKEYLKQLNEEHLTECEAIGEMIEEMQQIMIKIN